MELSSICDRRPHTYLDLRSRKATNYNTLKLLQLSCDNSTAISHKHREVPILSPKFPQNPFPALPSSPLRKPLHPQLHLPCCWTRRTASRLTWDTRSAAPEFSLSSRKSSVNSPPSATTLAELSWSWDFVEAKFSIVPALKKTTATLPWTGSVDSQLLALSSLLVHTTLRLSCLFVSISDPPYTGPMLGVVRGVLTSDQ